VVNQEKSYAFNDLEIRFVQVANQCAIAIRQARLTRYYCASGRTRKKLNRLKDDFYRFPRTADSIEYEDGNSDAANCFTTKQQELSPGFA